MKLFKIETFLIALLLFGCASTAEVFSDYDDSVDFNSFSTFVICLDDLYVENTKFPNYDNNEVRQLIGDEIESQMERKGYKTNVLNPQLQAGFQIAVEEKAMTFNNCKVQDEYNYWEKCTLQIVEYTEETLVVYVSDIEKNQIIWQAFMTCDLNRSKTALKDYVRKIVETLFNEYPEVGVEDDIL